MKNLGPGAELTAWSQSIQFKGVSILALVEVLPWGIRGQAPIFTTTDVSILVLVEVLPWALHSCVVFLGDTCFNPCSGGSIALGNCNLIRLGDLTTLFQSLFWWKYCPGSTTTARLRPGSLRSFNPCSGGSIALGGDIISAPASVTCFNPCSGGSIALGNASKAFSVSPSMFQSLFWWKYCPGKASAIWPITSR